MKEFTNCPLTDFSVEENRSKMKEAIAVVESQLGAEHPLVIGGEKITTGEWIPSLNPSNPEQTIGKFAKASEKEAEKALQAATKTFETWKRKTAEARADFLFDAAEGMRRDRFEFAAWMVLEVGKSWGEADGDVAEAIDFLDFYAREAIRYSKVDGVTPVPGEKNELRYIPLGVGAVIPPWNFPLAILVGMTSAAFVSGNTVVLKPSSDSPGIGMRFMRLLEEVGLPGGVVNFMTGSGALAGEYLVKDPRTRFISFTGSMEVGLRINQLAAGHQPGQIWIKRVVAEMGGKDAILIDSEADLDAAVDGVAVSAFGYSGQKCSACSRAIVDASIYDAFVEKLKARVERITIGDPRNPDHFMGPVVNEKALKSISEYIEIGKKEGKLLTGGGRASDKGFFLQPTTIVDVDRKARIAQEEIFGPVLAVIKARDFDDGLAIANDTIYGLTGAVYSRNPEKLKRAADEFHVGNLYFNRRCTAALVGGHPFGGFNMSGTDSKAGGKDYLLLFQQAKLVSEAITKAHAGGGSG